MHWLDHYTFPREAQMQVTSSLVSWSSMHDCYRILPPGDMYTSQLHTFQNVLG